MNFHSVLVEALLEKEAMGTVEVEWKHYYKEDPWIKFEPPGGERELFLPLVKDTLFTESFIVILKHTK
jgi:hypothetical protein